jgi:hypothetical protein
MVYQVRACGGTADDGHPPLVGVDSLGVRGPEQHPFDLLFVESFAHGEDHAGLDVALAHCAVREEAAAREVAGAPAGRSEGETVLPSKYFGRLATIRVPRGETVLPLRLAKSHLASRNIADVVMIP